MSFAKIALQITKYVTLRAVTAAPVAVTGVGVEPAQRRGECRMPMHCHKLTNILSNSAKMV